MCSRFEEICVCLEDVKLLYEIARHQQMGGPTDGSGHPPSPHQHDSRTCPLSFFTSAIASSVLSFPSQSPPTLAGSVLLTGHMLVCALTAGFFRIGRRLCFVHWSQDLVGAFVVGVFCICRRRLLCAGRRLLCDHWPQALFLHTGRKLVFANLPHFLFCYPASSNPIPPSPAHGPPQPSPPPLPTTTLAFHPIIIPKPEPFPPRPPHPRLSPLISSPPVRPVAHPL